MSDPDIFPDVESSLFAGVVRLRGIDPEVDCGEEDHSVLAARARLKELAQSERRKRYVLEHEIGRGGMGAVYKVLDTDLRRSLAMKVVLGVDCARVDAVALARFLEEAQVTGQLDHPGIVPLHEVGMDGQGRVYFTMRLVRGKHLGEIFELCRINQDGWNLERAIESLVKVCDAMAYAHSKGVVHRDLKPQNVMAGRYGEVYVMDWGVARVEGRPVRAPQGATGESLSIVRTGHEKDTGLESSGSVYGTPSFMAPEQARGELEAIDARTDVYSVGAILYQLLTGRAPYVPSGARVAGAIVLQWVLEGPPKPVLELCPTASRELACICAKSMEREKDRRYPDMQALAADLRAWLAGRPVSAMPLSIGARAARWCRRNPWVAATLLAVTLGGAFGLWALARLGSDLVREAARDDAASKARMLETVNAIYAAEVAGRVDRAHVEVTHDWSSKPSAIPLPATFLTDLAAQISAEGGGVVVKHYSDYPFRFRGEPKLDDFGRRALASLRKDPNTPVESFEEIEGRPVLRFAAARRMTQACVTCHNAHPESTKHDWKVGDVRGVLEIVRPLDQDVERNRSGLRSALLVVAAIVLGLTGLSAYTLVRVARRKSQR